MASVTFWTTAVAVVVLIVGFAVAADQDWRRREVDWEVWGLMGSVGVVLGVVALAPGGGLPVALWLLVGGLLLEHFVGWDEWFGARIEAHADQLELAGYVGTVLIVATAAARFGVGPSGVPVAVLALLSMIVLGRLLFVANVLYGAADAQALMVAAALLPVLPVPWLYAPSIGSVALAYLPFSISMLTNTALFSLALPIYLAVRNLSRGEFSGRQGFLGYSLPVRELPDRFVWVKDPAVTGGPQDDLETAEEDAQARIEIARTLEAKGISRVWVGPQIPLVTIMAFGAVAAILAGNLLLDLMLVLFPAH